MTDTKPMTKEEKIAELERRKLAASQDPAAFINYFCWTFDPKQKGSSPHLPFKLFPFQEDKIVKETKLAIEQGYDVFFDKTRAMGATYTILDVFLWFWLYVPGSNFLLGSRKEAYVDNTKDAGAVTNKEESLFGKIEYTLRRLPGFMLPKGFSFRKHLSYMSLTNPENGNVITGESSNPNFSRAGRQKAILLDEFAFWDNDTAAWGATADTTDCRIVLTTPGIKPGKAKRLRFGKDGEKIKVIELPYYLDPRKDKAWLDTERQRRSAEDFAREIMMNWDTATAGRVYPEIENAKTGAYPYAPEWPLYLAWDFGLDGLAFSWWQKNMKNGLWRLIEAYKTEDKPIHYVFPFFPKNPVDSLFQYSSDDLALMRVTCNWKKAIHFGDPDVAKRSITSREKTSTRLELEKAGIYMQTKPESNKFVIRREKTKVFLQKGIEVNNTPGTELWMESIQNARYPERSDTSQATTPVVLPIHDWTSHHRTALEYLAVNVDDLDPSGEDKYKKYENYPQQETEEDLI